MNNRIERMIRGWLHAVGRRLKADGEERETILDGLEEHIREALRERTGGRPATEDDLRAVLETIDPPSAFEGELETDPRKAEADRLARAAAWTLAGTVVTIVAVLLLALTRWISGGIAVYVGLAGFLAAAVMGFVAWRSLLGRVIGFAGVILLLAMLALVPMRVETRAETSERVQVETVE